MSSSVSSSCSSLLSDYRAGPRHHAFTRIGLDNYHDTVHGHEFGGLSRVVMVRKTDQRIFQSAKNGEVGSGKSVCRKTADLNKYTENYWPITADISPVNLEDTLKNMYKTK